MAYASAPVILDSTGQNIATSLATLAANIAAMKGATGTAGVGVASFVWYSNSGSDPQGTAGTVDTYRMTFTDGNHVDVSVYNGVNGLGALVWGNITGTLSDQMDLQAALNAKSDRPAHVAVTIDVADWSSKTCTKSVTGVTSDSNIIVTPDPDDYLAYSNAQIRATAQGNGTVTFVCETTPSQSITIDVLIVWAPQYATISGNLVQFWTIESVPAESLLVDVDAVQNLNGYSKPWPAGGGKNKLDMTGIETVTKSDITFTINADFSVTLSGVASGTAMLSIPCSLVNGKTYTASGITGGSSSTFQVYLLKTGGTTTSAGSFTSGSKTFIKDSGSYDVGIYRIRVLTGTNLSTPVTIYPMIEEGSPATTYEPYINICPISGWSDVNIYHEDEYDAGATPAYTIDLNGTRYGGTLDVITGVLTLTHGYIASYNGEVLPSTWISDRDEYAVGTTPTTGAEVVYELASPTTVQLTANQVNSLVGQNCIWANTGNVSVTYQNN